MPSLHHRQPATELASVKRGASLDAKTGRAPSGRAAEPAEPLLLSAGPADGAGAQGDSRPERGEERRGGPVVARWRATG